MRATDLNVVLFVTFFSLAVAISTDSSDRSARHFSLFSVVTFKNEECSSEATLAGGVRHGTCFTTTECNDKNGMKSGNCAAGFGVCCLMFANTDASAQSVSENRTYLRNAAFPTATSATAATTYAYTINKMSSDICQVRLDFASFTIAGPADTLETIPGATTPTNCQDTMTMVQTGGDTMPIICGALTGEHLYIDLGADASDTSVITIVTAISTTITPALAARVWDIKTSQIECFASYRAPPGCDRYLTDMSGKITSLNFLFVAAAGANLQNSATELGGQQLNTCIRRAKGMCCVEYLVCNSFNGIALSTDAVAISAASILGLGAIFSEGWRFDLNTTPMVIDAKQSNSGMVDAQCSSDYVEIPSSVSGVCGISSNVVQNTRYCGARFGANLMQAQNAIAIFALAMHTPVCDCSEPFHVRHGSDLSSDLGGSAAVNTAGTNTINGRGWCLDFAQKPCYF